MGRLGRDRKIYDGYIPFLINGDLKMGYIENPGFVEGDLALAFRERATRNGESINICFFVGEPLKHPTKWIG